MFDYLNHVYVAGIIMKKLREKKAQPTIIIYGFDQWRVKDFAVRQQQHKLNDILKEKVCQNH